MNNELILQPVVGMMLLTALVWVVLYARRIPAMKLTDLPTQTWKTPDKVVELLPEEISYPANNFRNLFELPVVFYALCLMLYVSGLVDGVFVVSAWVFVALRAVHSLIHCTVNRVMARFLSYLAASLVLWFMVLRSAVLVFAT